MGLVLDELSGEISGIPLVESECADGGDSDWNDSEYDGVVGEEEKEK